MTSLVLVYGPYPPDPGPEPAVTLATVRGLIGEGAKVEVVSPLPSGAHHHADVVGLRGSLRFARLVLTSRPRKVVAHLDPGVLRVRRGGRKELAARRLLGLALRDATVHLGDLSGRLDAPYVALALGRVGDVTVTSAGDREAVVAAGVAPAKVTVVSPAVENPTRSAAAPAAASALGPAPWAVGDTPSRETLEAEVRRRAANDRAVSAGQVTAALIAAEDPDPHRGPLSRISPYHAAAPVGSPRLLARLVKQVVWRLTKFELEPVVDHVNLLHRAAVEELAAQPGPDGTSPDGTSDAGSASSP